MVVGVVETVDVVVATVGVGTGTGVVDATAGCGV